MMAFNQSSSYPLPSMVCAGRLPPIWPFLDELLRRASIPQSTEILAQIKAKLIRLAEWGRDQLEGQLQLAEQTLTRVRDEHHRTHTQ
jgi:hypothetical protein